MSQKFSNFSAITTMIMSVLGGGTLFMPLAFQFVGYLGGFLSISCVGIFTFFSLYALLFVANKLNLKPASYPSLALQYGTVYKHAVDVSLFFSCFGAMINGFSKCSLQLFQNFSFGFDFSEKTSKIIYGPALLLCILPFCLQKEITSLKYNSYVSVSVTIYLISVLIYANLKLAPATIESVNTKIGDALSLFILALHCQFSIVSIYDSMENQTRRAIISTTSIASLASVFIYGTIGFTGYRLMGSEITSIILDAMTIGKGSLINRLKDKTIAGTFLVKMCSYGFIIVMFSSIPLAAFPIIPILNGWIFKDHNSELKRKISASILCVTVSLIAVFSPFSMDKMLFLNSAVFTNALSFVFPFLFYLKMQSEKTFFSYICVFSIFISLLLMGFQIFRAFL